jgi:hypothetical protein
MKNLIEACITGIALAKMSSRRNKKSPVVGLAEWLTTDWLAVAIECKCLI